MQPKNNIPISCCLRSISWEDSSYLIACWSVVCPPIHTTIKVKMCIEIHSLLWILCRLLSKDLEGLFIKAMILMVLRDHILKIQHDVGLEISVCCMAHTIIKCSSPMLFSCLLRIMNIKLCINRGNFIFREQSTRAMMKLALYTEAVSPCAPKHRFINLYSQ